MVAATALLVGGLTFSHARTHNADRTSPHSVYSVVWRDGKVQALYGSADDADHCHREDVVVEGSGSSFGVYAEVQAAGATQWTVCGTPGHADLFSADASAIGTTVSVNGRLFVVAK